MLPLHTVPSPYCAISFTPQTSTLMSCFDSLVCDGEGALFVKEGHDFPFEASPPPPRKMTTVTPIRTITPVADLTLHSRKWTAKVQVIEKQYPHKSAKGNRYQKFIFVDPQGTRIQGVIFESNIDGMGKWFQLFHSYLISNAIINYVEPKYRIVPNEYQWILSRTTAVTRLPEKNPCFENVSPEFSSYGDIIRLANSQSVIDIMGIVIDHSDPRPTMTKKGENLLQEFVLLNEENKPTILTLWKELIPGEGRAILSSKESRPIIIARHVAASKFKGRSLSSTPHSTIIVDPQTDQAERLRIWSKNNEPLIDDIVKHKKYQLENSSTSTNDVFQVCDVLNNHNITKFSIEGQLKLIDQNQEFYMMGCKFCKKGMDVEYGCDYECIVCQKTSSKPWPKILVEMFDGTGILPITLFGDTAEQLLNMDSSQMSLKIEMGEEISFPNLSKHLEECTYRVQIRAKRWGKDFRDQEKIQYTAVALNAMNSATTTARTSSYGEEKK